jgi:hypothetical protein
MASAVAPVEPSRGLVEGMVLLLGFLVFLLAFYSELLGYAQSLEQHSLLFLQVADHHLLPLSFSELVLQFLLLELLELLQFIEEVQFSFFMGLDMVHSDLVSPFCVLLLHVLALDLAQDCQLLNSR